MVKTAFGCNDNDDDNSHPKGKTESKFNSVEVAMPGRVCKQPLYSLIRNF